MNQSVLILSDDTDFPRVLVARWQSERTVPSFTVMSAAVWQPSPECSCDVAIVAGVEKHATALKQLDSTGVPVLYVAPDATSAAAARQRFPRVVTFKECDESLDAVVVIVTEMLRRVELAARARSAEARAKEFETQATLGRYMLEMRHSLNNALTSVLGNAELLLLEPGALSSEAREQIDTIHSMALRMHEVIQRFTSLETELSFAEKDSQSETAVWPRRIATRA